MYEQFMPRLGGLIAFYTEALTDGSHFAFRFGEERWRFRRGEKAHSARDFDFGHNLELLVEEVVDDPQDITE